MAWEQRGNRTYYYRKRRDGDRVVSEYVGAGHFATQVAQFQAMGDNWTKAARQIAREKREREAALDKEVANVCKLIQALVEATLAENGYHNHKGQWRRKRNR